MGDIDFISGVSHAAHNVFAFVFIDPKLLDRRDPHSEKNRDYVRDELTSSLEGLRTTFSDTEVDRIIDGALSSSPSVERRRLNVPGSVIIDPTNLSRTNRHSEANRHFIRGELDDHLDNLGHSMTDRQVDDIIDDALSAPSGTRRFAIRNLKVSVCLVNTQDEHSDSRREIATITSGIPRWRLRRVPGTDAIWDRAVGEHEGEHGNHTTLNFSTTKLSIIEEFRGDQQALQWLRANGHTDVAQALIDYRVLSAVHSPNAGHATGVALIAGDINKVNDSYVQAAEQMRARILQAVSREHGLGSERNAMRMFGYNPGRFIRTVERALARGEFRAAGTSPDLEDHVKAYIAAFRCQVSGITPPVPSGARASVDLESGSRSNLTIGEVSAPEFFASIADPDPAPIMADSDPALVSGESVRTPENAEISRTAGMKVV